MEASRRTWLAWLAMASLAPALAILAALAQDFPKPLIGARIENRKGLTRTPVVDRGS